MLFITCSFITTLDLSSRVFNRQLYNTTFTRADENFVSIYDGEPIRNWNDTTPSYLTSGTNGITLTSGNVYWGVKPSHRFYFTSQEALIANLSTEDLEALIQVPGSFPSESAGYSANEQGRIYACASSVFLLPRLSSPPVQSLIRADPFNSLAKRNSLLRHPSVRG